MRLTTRTSLAIRTLMFCAANPGRTVRKHEIATAYGASENHLAQVIHLLGQHGFIQTIRGRSGGMRLGRPMREISVGDVFRTFEATSPFTECLSSEGSDCLLAGCCRLTCALEKALESFYSSLDRLTLEDLVTGNSDLNRLLAVG